LNDVLLKDVRTIEDLVGGELVHILPPYNGISGIDEEPKAGPRYWKPRCPEAYKAIHAGISTVLHPTNCLQDQNRNDLRVEIASKLTKYLRKVKRPKPTKTHRINNEKFLQSPNRAGWLYIFALKTGKHWLAERIRVVNGDARVKEFVETGVVPAKTFTEQQERQAGDNECLSFDRYQFDGGLGHAPDSMTVMSDHADPRDIEHASQADAEKVAAIRQEIKALPLADQEFFWDYLGSRYMGSRTSTDRKRFQRLRMRVRQAVSQTA
jgi:hypothetical protein